MKNLIVLGAGGSAQSIVELVAELNGLSPSWRIAGFLDDDQSMHAKPFHGTKILESIDAARTMNDVSFVVGVASYRRPSQRIDIASRLNLPIDRFATLIHPLASVSRSANIGNGVLIFQYAVVSGSTTIDSHAYISQFAFIGHDAHVGQGAVMAPRSSLSGRSTVGEGTYIGAHAVIKDGVQVGDRSVVGMGAVVVGDVLADAVVAGNPAKPIAQRESVGKL